jgi:hypothetical protein
MFAALLLLTQAAAVPAAAPPASPKCEGPDYAAFDFWVGEWVVFPAGSDKQVATSKIEKLYGGCAIRENWMPLKGAGGGSLTARDPASGRWHQTWVGAAPGPVYFEGGAKDGGMILTGWWPGSGPKGEDGLTRMSYSRLAGGAVRQHGEFSVDHGVTWQTTFDFTYRSMGTKP